MDESIALEYIKAGYSVFPVHPETKKPYFPWKELQERIPTQEEVMRWFIQFGEANMALVTGIISELIVFDFDSEEIYKKYEKIIKNSGNPPIVKTNRGYHVYYRGKQYGNFIGIEEGLDVRCQGGYVIAPPSVNKKTGFEYKWISEMELLEYGEDEIPEVPSELNNLLKVKTYQSYGKTKDYIKEILEKGTKEGSRNKDLVKLAGYLFSKGLDFDIVLMIVSNWNEKNNPPMAQKELENVVKWLFEKHSKEDKVKSDLEKKMIVREFAKKNLKLSEKELKDTVNEIHSIYTNTSEENEKNVVISEQPTNEDLFAEIANKTGVEIKSIKREIDDENVVYIFETPDEKTFKINNENLMHFSRFQSGVIKTTKKAIEKPKHWIDIVNLFLRVVTDSEVDIEETFRGTIINYLSEFAEKHGEVQTIKNTMSNGLECFVKDKYFFFDVDRFRESVSLQSGEKLKRNEIIKEIKKLKWKKEKFSNYDKETKKKKQKWYYAIHENYINEKE